MIKKILIANRGEIACRIIKTAKKMGIATVAIFSEADEKTLHVQLADEAYCVGSAKSSESYLAIDKIIAVAKAAQVHAIHPGYGFLSENTEFAKACQSNHIIFIGPPIKAIEAMGSKSAAKKIMAQANVPLTPGYHGEEQSCEYLLEQAKQIQFPVMLKASAGGGGKGMRIVHTEADFLDALNAAKREAKGHFNDDKMLIERYVVNPRHIEIQVFADTHGNCVHLFERDCSIQRRHQKVVEEAPAPKLCDTLREKIAQAAVDAATAIDYVGAGTVEFLLDKQDNFYFMEMNTRLQVEHPVTEMITGLDLVEWQIKVAQGEPLPRNQKDIQKNGHALEVRLYAEDPHNQFLPSIGTLQVLNWPLLDSHVRIDTGFSQGDLVTPFYDPMLAKMIVWGENREIATLKLQQALNQLQIVGVKTNAQFLYNLISQPQFMSAQVHTGFIEEHHEVIFNEATEFDCKHLAIAALFHSQHQLNTKHHSSDPFSAWNHTTGFRLNLNSELMIKFLHSEKTICCRIYFQDDNYCIEVEDKKFNLQLLKLENNKINCRCDDKVLKYSIFKYENNYTLFCGTEQIELTLFDPIKNAFQNEQSNHSLSAPMPGTIVDFHVNTGEIVKKNTKLVTMEAMKMEHCIYAPEDGVIKELLYAVGDMVTEGSELLIFEESRHEPA